MQEKTREIKGCQFGVRLIWGGCCSSKISAQIITEDDCNWFEVGNSFCSSWLPELAEIITQADKLTEPDRAWPPKATNKTKKISIPYAFPPLPISEAGDYQINSLPILAWVVYAEDRGAWKEVKWYKTKNDWRDDRGNRVTPTHFYPLPPKITPGE